MGMSRTWHIGLTGGIGSGKSTVAAMLAQQGAAIVDADAISRGLTAPGGRAMPAIEKTFGADLVQSDGGLNRPAMRDLVFRDARARIQLEGIIHPLVAMVTREQAETAIKGGCRCVVHDVPLLVESGERWRSRVDRVVVVDCHVTTQRQRVIQRSGLAADEVDRIIAQQASRAQRLACADVVLFNQDLELPDLQAQVIELAQNFGL